MRWRNGTQHWGGISIGLHWLTAVAVFGIFGLGLWMVDLTYYDSWYRTGPHIHRSIGVLLFGLVLLRLLWRAVNPNPGPVPGQSRLITGASHAVHGLLYLGLLALMLSGYLISTADGRAVAVFDWFDVPALIHGREQQEEIAGDIHRWLAWGLIGLSLLHALAALKHHFIDRDATLKRMLRSSPDNPAITGGNP